MNPETILAWLGFGASMLRMIAERVGWSGGSKLSIELAAMAAKIDAFKTDPVYKSEIDAMKLSHTWGEQPPPQQP